MREEGVARDGIRVADGYLDSVSTASWRTSGGHAGADATRSADRAWRRGGAARRITTDVSSALYELVDPNRARLARWFPWVDDATDAPFAGRVASSAPRGAIARSTATASGSADDWRAGATCGSFGSDDIGELGFWLDEALVGRGLVTRAAQALMTRGFEEEGLHRVQLRAGVDNLRSRAVARRLRLKEEGVLRGAGKVGGGLYVDLVIYGPVVDDWRIRLSADRAVIFDLFGTLVPEFPHEDFYASIDHMATVLGADSTAFRDAWNETVVDRQTGGYADDGRERARDLRDARPARAGRRRGVVGAGTPRRDVPNRGSGHVTAPSRR